MNLEYRMYGLVPYNISEIQKGIQFGHAVVEYGLKYSNTPEYQKWAHEDKTFIILNGGTTNSRINIEDGLPFGSLNQHLLNLERLVKDGNIAWFNEPDLGDQLTAICFLVDERIWDIKKYFSPGDIELEPHEITWYDRLKDDEYEYIFLMRDFLSKLRLA